MEFKRIRSIAVMLMLAVTFARLPAPIPALAETQSEPTEADVLYTAENGWVKGGATEFSDGTLKLGKGKANAAIYTPDLEYGKVYEITYDVNGLTKVSGSGKKPFTLTLSAGKKTESNVLTYSMVGSWRDAATGQVYATGRNGQNKIVIDTASGEWEAYALGKKATYSGFTSNAINTSKSYSAFPVTSNFSLRFYAYDTTDDFDTPSIGNVTVTELAPTDFSSESPVVSGYEITSSGQVVDTPDGLRNFGVKIRFQPQARNVGNVTLFAAVYGENNRLIGFGETNQTVGGAIASAAVNVSLTTPYSDTRHTVKVMAWDSARSLRPLTPAVAPCEGVLAYPIADGVDLHNDIMRAYLDDAYTDVAEYAWGGIDKDDPKPVSFHWASKEGYTNYTLEISENQDMSDPRTVTTTKRDYDVYNLKVGTTYYWRVTASNKTDTQVSEVSSFTTGGDAPRCIQATGLANARDVGGWMTEDGKRVRQGMVYRSYCYDYVKSGKTVTLLKADGVNTLVNELGIRSEVDLRNESTKTSSILGDGVHYYRFGMNYDGDLMENNKQAIKGVFEVLADPANYPVSWHCQAGADRTGVITYLLNGLLGVPKEDLLRDYLITNFMVTASGERSLSDISALYVKTLDEYEGTTLSDKIARYLNQEIGVSTQDLDFIKGYLTEEYIP